MSPVPIFEYLGLHNLQVLCFLQSCKPLYLPHCGQACTNVPPPVLPLMCPDSSISAFLRSKSFTMGLFAHQSQQEEHLEFTECLLSLHIYGQIIKESAL